MFRPRIIPVLLLRGHGLVKTRKFKDAVYVGDPLNAVRIFAEKEADEIIILDIDASRKGRGPNFELIEEIAGECLMPMAYGGGISSYEQVRQLVRSGVEKVVINSAAGKGNMDIISRSAAAFGSQAVVGSIDVKSTLLRGYRVAIKSGTVEISAKPEEYAQALVAAGVGEIFINSIDADGTMTGMDLKIIRRIADCVNVPVIACGGAGSSADLKSALTEGGASAVAAGSMFVFHGIHRAVLINYNPNVVMD